jgi:hypothetical protein
MSQQRVHDPDASLPSAGSARALVPPFPRYYQGTATPAAHPAALRFLRLAVPREPSAVFVSPAAAECQASGLGLVTRYPRPGLLPWSKQVLPSSWGTPIPVCTCSPTPAGRCVPDRLWDARVAPAQGTTKAPTTIDFRGPLAWLSGSLPTYHDVGRPSSRKGSLPGAGQAPRAGFHPQGSYERFPTHFMFVFLLSQASWHNPRFDSARQRARNSRL